MTVREALGSAEQILRLSSVEEARLDAEYLLAEVLKCPRLLVCASGETPLTPAREAMFFSLISRRAQREPLQYILGTQVFMGLTFRVTPDALIPRADTETLCEQALLCALDGASVLDLCTGSGALGISIKKLCPSCSVTATDVSEKALAIARENANALGAAVSFKQGDLFEAVIGARFDVIVSNPPYIPDADIATLQTEVRREPRLALSGGDDGLAFYRRIAYEAPRHLNKNGVLLLEIGDTQERAVRGLLANAFEDTIMVRDLSGRPRVVRGRVREAAVCDQG